MSEELNKIEQEAKSIIRKVLDNETYSLEQIGVLQYKVLDNRRQVYVDLGTSEWGDRTYKFDQVVSYATNILIHILYCCEESAEVGPRTDLEREIGILDEYLHLINTGKLANCLYY